MVGDKLKAGLNQENADFDANVEHSPEFNEKLLKRGKKLLEKTNPDLLKLMEKLKNKK